MNAFIEPSNKRAATRKPIVIKLGGSVLSGSSNIRRAARLVKDASREAPVVVVVSAMKGVTDGLIDTAKDANPETPPELMAEIITMGERVSARIFAAALTAEDLKPVVVDPDSDAWPIISRGDPLDAEVVFEETEKLVREKIGPILESGFVPVVCGFIGKTRDGKIQALGRGGSDTTAVVLASALRADEVVLVKDVGSVMSGDPKKASGVVPVKELDSEEAMMLSLGGSRLIHKKAFKYLMNGVRIRIASLEEGVRGGTVIEDVEPILAVERDDGNISMVTVVGESAKEKVNALLEGVKASGGELVSLSVSEKAAIIYVRGGENVYDAIHRAAISTGAGKAVSVFEGLSRITVRGKALETIPGYISRVVEPLSRNNINIYGMYTIASSIRLFVDSKEAERAEKLIRESLGE